MRQQYIVKRFNSESRAMIERVNTILADYQGQGYRLSLRQLYYQLVARAVIKNSLKSYKNVGNLVSEARLAGLVDWDMIEDRGRGTVAPPMWEDPAAIVDAAASQFAIDRWKDQANHVEVMVEKAALEGVLIPVCRDLGIRFSANRGYSSSSEMRLVGLRLKAAISRGKTVWMLYLGDHDPSGIDMTRDVRERLGLFAGEEIGVKRLALNMDQVEELDPPENPAKLTDSRADAYIDRFGESSWELDAIEPAALAQIVVDAVEALRDEKLWVAALKRENKMRLELKRFVKTYKAKGKRPAKKKLAAKKTIKKKAAKRKAAKTAKPKGETPLDALIRKGRKMQERYARLKWDFSPRAVAGTFRIDLSRAMDVYNAVIRLPAPRGS